ncbi:MAG TPA: bifunctional hydroxymethylpyrimidine kinase/phosphomethylpyrimidine kinase [Candidatus Binatia bacterium]|nr:bifunctional hydroxymethylpyrimidine kinase/phosphomethylpyrimidine kinase [Candidatus Binatia bacterium]
MQVALSIAGSDPSGGAGVQADLKTFHAFGVYGAAVITTLTAQSTAGVRGVLPVDPEFVGLQLETVLDDVPVAAAKTGLLGRAAIVERVAAILRARPVPALVVDPVAVAGTGQPLADADMLPALRRALLPLATLVTPNLAEAAALTGRPVHDVETMRAAARACVDLGARAALVTGGHLPGAPRDVLCVGGALSELAGERVGPPTAHGAGCTLSAAIAAALAAGLALPDAVARARRYVARALAAAPPLGHGHPPLDHRVAAD